eukprot:7632824-Heterocapsa_arctica.AAC.1
MPPRLETDPQCCNNGHLNLFGATTHTHWGAVSAAYKVVADCMEKELIGITGAELEKTGVRSMPPILANSMGKPLETSQATCQQSQGG